MPDHPTHITFILSRWGWGSPQHIRGGKYDIISYINFDIKYTKKDDLKGGTRRKWWGKFRGGWGGIRWQRWWGCSPPREGWHRGWGGEWWKKWQEDPQMLRRRKRAMRRRGEGPPKLRGDPSSSGRRGVLLFQKGFCALCPVPSSLYFALLKSDCSLFTVLCAQQNLSVASCLLALHSHSLAWGPQPSPTILVIIKALWEKWKWKSWMKTRTAIWCRCFFAQSPYHPYYHHHQNPCFP